ncbi:shock factor protein 4 [Seminavis robusta]|uniref:Shock factor protein 4 n=1 Tax=Seminavis robusta TaxID=568900 RepID=A0A9N8H1B9_9STRA|nr:shock factor protein 4 [Seminavis robusta]|eukprot:Sro14_g010650.1 shock factor protein 4 (597) ;mRNA; f:107857-109750
MSNQPNTDASNSTEEDNMQQNETAIDVQAALQEALAMASTPNNPLLASLLGNQQQRPPLRPQPNPQQHAVELPQQQQVLQRPPPRSQQQEGSHNSHLHSIQALLSLQQPRLDSLQAQSQNMQNFATARPHRIGSLPSTEGSNFASRSSADTMAAAHASGGETTPHVARADHQQLIQRFSALLQAPLPAPGPSPPERQRASAQQPNQPSLQPYPQQQSSNPVARASSSAPQNVFDGTEEPLALINASMPSSAFPLANAAQQVATFLRTNPEMLNDAQDVLRQAIDTLRHGDLGLEQLSASEAASSSQGPNNDAMETLMAQIPQQNLLADLQTQLAAAAPLASSNPDVATPQQPPNSLPFQQWLQAQATLQHPTSQQATGEDAGRSLRPDPAQVRSLSFSNVLTGEFPPAAAAPSSAPSSVAGGGGESVATTQSKATSGSAEGKKPRGRSAAFPRKLYQMLMDLENQEGGKEIASFLLPHGRAFRVHKPKEFTQDVMPQYFKMGSWTSFQRQLNLYDFQRITEGPERDAYYHEWFVRGQPEQCKRIKRNKAKSLTRAKQQERLREYEKAKEADVAFDASDDHEDMEDDEMDEGGQLGI